MSDQHNEPQNKVSLEELLRVKRSEKPDSEFWGQFDRELHQRMLQTLVKKEPWYWQLLRALRSRMAQAATVSGLAALLLLALSHTFFSKPIEEDGVIAQAAPTQSSELPEGVQVVEAISSLTPEPLQSRLLAAINISSKEYQIEAIQSQQLPSDSGLEREFALESLQVASYDSAAYREDVTASTLSYVTAGMTSLVY